MVNIWFWFFFFKQKTAYEISACLVGSEMCIRDRYYSYPQTLEQFHVSDERKAVEVERDLKKLGREPVWKDWDQSFDFKR